MLGYTDLYKDEMVEYNSFSHVCDCDTRHSRQTAKHKALGIWSAPLSIRPRYSHSPEPTPLVSSHADRLVSRRDPYLPLQIVRRGGKTTK